jgi:mRNA-degrading endonuclease toxin of MazEF toxin-antitoxin module
MRRLFRDEAAQHGARALGDRPAVVVQPEARGAARRVRLAAALE